jgi:LysR family hydrogen peroxide-inducible transcriptional activator
MNIHQFQYVLALAENRHFETAAEKCFISQSTLSTMILRFEEEIGVPIFDRKKKPVEVTLEGQRVIQQLKKITKEIQGLKEVANELKGEVSGKLTIAVIPTIAPYILPLFLHRFAAQFPKLEIEVREHTTTEIIRMIKSRDLDIGIISIPILDNELIEYHLYDEPFVYYDTGIKNKKQVQEKHLRLDNLCLLEEGHCMRNQVLELCDYHNRVLKNKLNFNYKAGSIDGLLRFVRANNASTLLPLLAALDLSKEEQKRVSKFMEPVPFRSVGIVVHQHFVKHQVRELLQTEILSEVKKRLPRHASDGRQLAPI